MPGKKPDRQFETPKILHDWPLKRSQTAYFNFDDFAVTLSRLVASKETDTPLTIGVSGKWGSGKTTLLRRLEKMLDATTALYDPTRPALLEFCGGDESPQKLFRPCRTVWFNAWKYADEEQLLVALIRVIVQEMSKDDVVSKVLAKLLDPAYPRRDVVDTVLGWFSIKLPGEVGLKLNTGAPRETPFGEKTATLDLFNEAFDRLLAAWVHRSVDAAKIDPKNGVLVVFVDDLDRCLPPKMVQVLEAVKLFLDKEGCVFVLGADKDIVQQAIEKQYETAGIRGQSAADYLEKIMQLRFELPVTSHDDMQTLLDGEKIIGADWGDSWRLLITGAEINPRKVKTFVNDLNLGWAILVNTGQARGVNRADFNAWQVLMRVAPANFVQQVRERLDDLELRYNFVMDAIKWGRGEGDEMLKTTFQDYDSWRLRRVLREIAFSEGFDAGVLDAFVHMVAPPEKPAPPPEPVPEKLPAQVKEPERERESFEVGLPAEPEQLETSKGVTRGGVGRDVIPPRGSREGAIVVGNMEFMLVAKGKFIMGSKEDDKDASDNEKPQHTVEIPYDYWLARFTVTNEQFGQFIKASGYKTTAEQQGSAYVYDGKDWKDTKGANWQHPRGPKSGIQDRADHPVVSVSWLDAMEYVQWLTGEMRSALQNDPRLASFVFRLPTEAEWEKAARGVYGNLYPWGNEFDQSRCNSRESGKMDTVPVNAFPNGASPSGCEQMSGNVWEWTRSLFEKYPYAPDGKRENETDKNSVRVLRGGSFVSIRQGARAAVRRGSFPAVRIAYLGFRVVLAPHLS